MEIQPMQKVKLPIFKKIYLPIALQIPLEVQLFLEKYEVPRL